MFLRVKHKDTAFAGSILEHFCGVTQQNPCINRAGRPQPCHPYAGPAYHSIQYSSCTMPNPSSGSTLPSPRDLLTSIFNSLPQTATTLELGLPNNNPNSNPLKALSAIHRSLLVTLHVLFPSLLLQALDLLDRGLVTRVVQVTPSTTSEPQATTVRPPQAHIHLPVTEHSESGDGEQPEGQGVNQGQKRNENTIYLVRSAQSTHSRSASSSSRYSTAQGHSYIVRLTAWNCSCAAFAFSAFPASTSGPFSPRFEDTASGARDAPETDTAWEFGGLSSNGTAGHGEGVPCCKHLMACLMAERWERVLGGYVKQMRVGREEMAGLGADGGV